MFSSMNTPRLTGDVRDGFDVTDNMVPCVRTPPRGLSAGNSTSRISAPFTPSIPYISASRSLTNVYRLSMSSSRLRSFRMMCPKNISVSRLIAMRVAALNFSVIGLSARLFLRAFASSSSVTGLLLSAFELNRRRKTLVTSSSSF